MPPAQTSQQAMQNLQSYASSAKTPEQAMNEANNQFGVNAAQQQVQGLRGAIQNTTNLLQQVAPSVMGRTANSLVTSAQADRQIQNEQAPLNTQLNTENQQYGNANQDYQNVLGEAQNQANAVLAGQESQKSYLQNLYNDLYTKEQNAAQQAEAQREFNAQLSAQREAASRAAASANPGASPTFGGGNQGGGGAIGNVARNAVGGYSFTDGSGRPITMGQYLDMNGGSPQMAVQLLSQGSAHDRQIAGQIRQLLANRTPASKLAAMFPQVFGG